MYSLIKPFLFHLDPERAHDFTIHKMQLLSRSAWLSEKINTQFAAKLPKLPVHCMGLEFRHPIGLAAGLDKDARALPALSALGFSGVELGTVTPKPQPGNEKPRMFRLPEDQALINRMGFNSGGIDAFLENLSPVDNGAKLGINLGKNAVTPIEDAHMDYVSALQKVYRYADYITINISSPNTKSLRDLQNEEYLDSLLLNISTARAKCAKVHKRKIPIALKVAPDLSSEEIETISDLLLSHDFEALIACNTTIARPETLKGEHAQETGGLSGEPVKEASTEVIRQFYKRLQGKVQIIGVGGIGNADDAWEKLLAGADYLQVYTQFIYQGPQLIKNIVCGLEKKVKERGFESLTDALLRLRD